MSTEIEVFIQRRYRCPHCRKSWASVTRARRHIEEGCWSDVRIRTCKTCKHDVREVIGSPMFGPGSPGHCLIDARDVEEWIRECPMWEGRAS